MEIGFIGNSAFMGRIVSSLRKTEHSVCGVYHSRKTKPGRDVNEYGSAEALISDADLVYIAQDELPLFEISQIAIKETKHLFFENPILLDYEAFRHLFHLARESKSVIRFSQKLRTHPVYTPVRDQLHPLFVSFRLDAYQELKAFDDRKRVLFDIASVIWDTLHRELRKMHYFPLEYHTQYPGSFFFDMVFDNGTHVNLLFNHLAGVPAFYAEFIQPSKRFLLDFIGPGLSVYDEIRGSYEPSVGKLGSEAEWVAKDFKNFVLNLKDARLPLTINEDNQSVLYLTHSLLNEMNYKTQLMA
jgi:hypothetical protein